MGLGEKIAASCAVLFFIAGCASKIEGQASVATATVRPVDEPEPTEKCDFKFFPTEKTILIREFYLSKEVGSELVYEYRSVQCMIESDRIATSTSPERPIFWWEWIWNSENVVTQIGALKFWRIEVQNPPPAMYRYWAKDRLL